jgi:respiratory burst oxidase
MARARQFSQDLTKRFGRSHSRSEAQAPSGLESALAARAARRQRAQLDRTRSGAHKALRGLRFISSNKANNAWMEVQANFDRLARDGYLSRSDFAECIGIPTHRSPTTTIFPPTELLSHAASATLSSCRDDGIEGVRARAVRHAEPATTDEGGHD